MEKNKNFDNIIHSDSSGRLYIKSHDFFSQPKVKEMVGALVDSSIFKKITQDKNKR